MKIRLIRHATLWLEIHGQQFLVDPMFADRGAFPSLTIGRTAMKNPVADLAGDPESLSRPDAVLVTHSHFDHFDGRAAALISKEVPFFCQPGDRARIKRKGFLRVVEVTDKASGPGGLELFRTRGRHGRGLMGRLMGRVSGFVIRAPGEPVLYITGDTVWCPEVAEALTRHRPQVVVAFAGAARFNAGAPITMDADDVARVCRSAPRASVVAVHMEAINHCRLGRDDLARALETKDLSAQVFIPRDGETLNFSASALAVGD